MTRVIFLGTSAALPTGERGNVCLGVIGAAPNAGLLIDCGDGVYRALLRAEIGPDALDDIFITHAHIDHIGALPSLIESLRLAGRRRPLRIYALPEVLAIAQRLVAVYDFELKLDHWEFPVSFHAVDEGQDVTLAGVPAHVYRMDHSVLSAGLRLDFPTGVLAYTCDTQPTSNIAQLGTQARLFITEATFLSKDVEYARRGKHMTALEAGQQAAACEAGTLALVHLGVADGWNPADASAEAGQAFSGPIVVPQDGDTLEM
ncbi:MAG: MBL fold metallo-hydrolase [Ktedonobacterales bacterium]